MVSPRHVLSEAEASLESFHDCHVHGLQWQRDRFTFALSLHYILEWIPPSEGSSRYRFSIAEAVLTFRDVDELAVSMDWAGCALDAQIATVHLRDTRSTASGQVQRHFEIEFPIPMR